MAFRTTVGRSTTELQETRAGSLGFKCDKIPAYSVLAYVRYVYKELMVNSQLITYSMHLREFSLSFQIGLEFYTTLTV